MNYSFSNVSAPISIYCLLFNGTRNTSIGITLFPMAVVGFQVSRLRQSLSLPLVSLARTLAQRPLQLSGQGGLLVTSQDIHPPPTSTTTIITNIPPAHLRITTSITFATRVWLDSYTRATITKLVADHFHRSHYLSALKQTRKSINLPKLRA